MKPLRFLTNPDAWMVSAEDVSNAVLSSEETLELARKIRQHYQENKMPKPKGVRTRDTSRRPVPSVAEANPQISSDPAPNRSTSQREAVAAAGNAYAEARARWREANDSLEKSDPCSHNHPEKVKAAILAHAGMIEASERVQAACRKGS